MDAFFTYISSHFLEALIVLLLSLLFFKEAFIGWISSFVGHVPQTQRVADNVEHLRNHYNDDITQILTELQVGQKEGKDMVRTMMQTQADNSGKLDEMRDILRDISRNGIRIRK